MISFIFLLLTTAQWGNILTLIKKTFVKDQGQHLLSFTSTNFHDCVLFGVNKMSFLWNKN